LFFQRKEKFTEKGQKNVKSTKKKAHTLFERENRGRSIKGNLKKKKGEGSYSSGKGGILRRSKKKEPGGFTIGDNGREGECEPAMNLRKG